MSTVSGPERAVPRPAARSRPWRLRLNGWLRWLHVYTSTLSLMVVLFFSLTGITLNHPEWTFGNSAARQQLTGTLPAGWRQGTTINWLEVVEDLRAAHDLKGRASDERADAREASVSFHAPGYAADAFIDVQTGKYTLSVDAPGLVATLNDFHRGRDAGTAWSWIIDLSGVFLAVVAVTGLGLLLYLKKLRLSALAVMTVATVLVVGLMHLAR